MIPANSFEKISYTITTTNFTVDFFHRMTIVFIPPYKEVTILLCVYVCGGGVYFFIFFF